MGHSAKEADLLTTNMYHFIKDLIKNRIKEKKPND